MNWTDFKIDTETAHVNSAAETVHVHTMSSHATELCGKTLTFFSHNRNGYEQYYNLFEDFIQDVLANVSHRADFTFTLEESNDDEKVINMMVGTFFAIHGLDMDEHNYKHSTEENGGMDNDFNTVTNPIRYIYKVIVHRTYDEYLDVPATNEKQALEIAHKALHGEKGYDYDEYLYHTVYDTEPDWINDIKIELHDLQSYEVYNENI